MQRFFIRNLVKYFLMDLLFSSIFCPIGALKTQQLILTHQNVPIFGEKLPIFLQNMPNRFLHRSR